MQPYGKAGIPSCWGLGAGQHRTSKRALDYPAGAAEEECLYPKSRTPGLRELQLWGEESSIEGSLSDIGTLAKGCRFNNCSHTGDPGCAVQQALANGSMDHGRFESFLDLQKELRHLKRKQDIRTQLYTLAYTHSIVMIFSTFLNSGSPVGITALYITAVAAAKQSA